MSVARRVHAIDGSALKVMIDTDARKTKQVEAVPSLYPDLE